jgi:hypothetical protein
MNPRIRELVKQAGIDLPDDTVYNGHIYKNSIERLANLLEQEFFSQGYLAGKSDGIQETVQECVRYFNEDYQRDFDTLWREDLSKRIKQHFGVE